ncbi:MAG: SDR family NAD(P)-dependent oxidoreductase [Gammaproteobacteria bacterium]|nr:SDR family NAD(P)-dependent oxidoreductase [Gammaproteobacteria bacterium]
MYDFKGKVAVITGGASGIGFALADRLAGLGCHIALADVEAAALSEAAERLRRPGTEVLPVPTDVAAERDVLGLADAVFNRFGHVHLLFNNAGVALIKSLAETEINDWKWLLGVNLWGVIHGISAFLPRMEQQGQEARIINTASIGGLAAVPEIGAYGASKHAVAAITETLQKELAHTGSNVKTALLCPSYVNTRIGASERNRPERYKTRPSTATPRNPHPGPAAGGGGFEAGDVADWVIEGIHADRFYIFPPGPQLRGVEKRFRNILRAAASRPEP